MRRTIGIGLVMWVVLALQACSNDPPTSPEEEIRAWIDRGIEAAEARSAGKLSDMIAEDYSDQKGFNKKRMVDTLRFYFLRHQNIHLFKKIESIALLTQDEAEVVIHVAMAGSRIADAGMLANLRAQIYRFELQLSKEDDWLLRQASWRPSSLAGIE